MSKLVPTFSGETAYKSVIKFIQDFKLYVATKDLNAGQRNAVLAAAIQGVAQTAYQAAIVGGAIAGAADHIDRYNNSMTWLQNTYHTADKQQQLKDQLISAYQRMDESPLAFYQQIRKIIQYTGYTDAVQDQVAESVFTNGLFKELQMLVRSTPTPLALNQKVEYVQRYWSAQHPEHDALEQVPNPSTGIPL